MPLNTLRLNAQASSHPNDRIVFIKPLPRPPPLQTDYETTDTFLRAIAAQCLPIMKSHHLSITTLEEHEPNREFIGRNFNNGEIIQLVLRSKSGAWLPFHMVQMVMMHELAHNTHMNHGKGFWAERNRYAEEMRGLWGRGYTGEGFWGGGRRLEDMAGVMGNNIVDKEVLKDLPVCGGTYRSRRRKRKAREELSWKEKRDRRIEKKFGKNGVRMGEDEDKRLLLEIRKKGPIGGKPRVAQSMRGRELRAAAALARFDTNKKEVDALKEEGEEEEEEEEEEEDIKSENFSDSEDYEDVDTGLEDARDSNGQRVTDGKGNSMVRVCGDEDGDTGTDSFYIKQEMEELEGLERYLPHRIPESNGHDDSNTITPNTHGTHRTQSPARDVPHPQHRIFTHADGSINPSKASTPPQKGATEWTSIKAPSSAQVSVLDPSQKSVLTCPICSLTNDSSPTVLICSACAHVLHPDRDKGSWACPSASCKALGGGTGYINAGDVRICGLCETQKP